MQNITVKGVLAGTFAFLAMCFAIQSAYGATPERNAYFGDVNGNLKLTPFGARSAR